jgi:hypothetical protein
VLLSLVVVDVIVVVAEDVVDVRVVVTDVPVVVKCVIVIEVTVAVLVVEFSKQQTPTPCMAIKTTARHFHSAELNVAT